VLRESKAVYRAASEGVINLADKFFEMGKPDALRGLDLYKDALALHEKLTQYYAAMQAVPALKCARGRGRGFRARGLGFGFIMKRGWLVALPARPSGLRRPEPASSPCHTAHRHPPRTAINYPALQPLPADFVTTMEQYIKDGAAAANKVGARVGSHSCH